MSEGCRWTKQAQEFLNIIQAQIQKVQVSQ